MTTMTTEDLRRYALIGLETERARIDAAMAELRNGHSTPSEVVAAESRPSSRPGMTSEVRKRLSLAMKRRWREAKKRGRATLP